jgi:hypothetical protein
MADFLLLAVATEQEEHLRLECVSGSGFVEFGQEWVFFKDLEEQASAKVVT